MHCAFAVFVALFFFFAPMHPYRRSVDLYLVYLMFSFFLGRPYGHTIGVEAVTYHFFPVYLMWL